MARFNRDPVADRLTHPGEALASELDEIAISCASLPLMDDRAEDEILGYDDRGIPARR